MLTPQSRQLLDRFARAGVLPFDQMSVLAARASVAAGTRLQGEPAAVAQVVDLLAPGADGELPVRLYHPSPGEEVPLLVYFHGGGWVTGGVEVADIPCRALAAGTGAAVASVGYRLSPETRYPGPAEDCWAATCWLAGAAARWGACPDRLAVCGDSAGGNLAAAVTLLARDRGGPAVAAQVLLYPPLVPPWAGATQSMVDNAEGYGLTRGGLEWFWRHYLGREGGEGDPYACPLLAADLRDLPPALVVAAEYDPLRDEDLAYAGRLSAAGVDVETVCYPGLVHGFFWMAGVLPEGRGVVDVVARRLDALLAPQRCQHSS